MTRERSAWEQVKSGFRIAFTLILALLFFIALDVSVSALTGEYAAKEQLSYRLVGGVSLALLSSILFVTTRIWAKWLLGILAFCALRLTVGVPAILILGKMRKADLYSALLMMPLCLSSTVTLLPFLKRPAHGLERVALVVFLDSLIFALVLQSWVPWLIGLVVLAATEALAFLLNRHSSRRQNLAPSA